MQEITRIPNSPAFIRGIINVRGRILVVVSLREKFKLEPQEGRYILIADADGSSFGIMVDKVTEILRIKSEDVKKAPSIVAEKIHGEYLKGVAVLGERLIILLNLQKILSEGEMTKIQEAKSGPMKVHN